MKDNASEMQVLRPSPACVCAALPTPVACTAGSYSDLISILARSSAAHRVNVRRMRDIHRLLVHVIERIFIPSGTVKSQASWTEWIYMKSDQFKELFSFVFGLVGGS